MNEIDRLIELGRYEEAETAALSFYSDLEKHKKSDIYFSSIFNVASFLSDLGHFNQKPNLSKQAVHMLEQNEVEILKVVETPDYLYNLANAKNELLTFREPFDLGFHNIEEIVEIKNLYWRAFSEYRKMGKTPNELLVNLSNCLKRQFRICESMELYDRVNDCDEISQSWINRSDSLDYFRKIAKKEDDALLLEIALGYKVASTLFLPNEHWNQYYQDKSIEFQSLLSDAFYQTPDLHDERKGISDYDKFLTNKNLVLSESSIYDKQSPFKDELCVKASHLEGHKLKIARTSINRILSEYTFSTLSYFGFCQDLSNEYKELKALVSQSCNSIDSHSLSLEKVRASFRSCFGILDKIAISLCTVFDIKKDGHVYFRDFWSFRKKGRRELFEKHKNPGMLALYSIATDLNSHAQGEWSHLKDWRDAMEHGAFIISDDKNAQATSFSDKDNTVVVNEGEFLYALERLLILTRSAIFSLVFAFNYNDNNDVNIIVS